MYFNTFLLQLFVYADFDGFTLKGLVKDTFLDSLIPEVQYKSMNRSWFSHVGNGIIFTMIIKVVNPSVVIFFISLLKR